jgi:hypothetical protein
MTNLLIDNYTDEDVVGYLLNLDSSHDHAEFVDVTQKNMRQSTCVLLFNKSTRI